CHRTAPDRANPRSSLQAERRTRSDARPRARDLAAEETRPARLRRVRARRLALHRAGLHFLPLPAPPSHRVPVALRLEPALESHHAVLVAPPARHSSARAPLHGHSARRAALRARPAIGRPAARDLPLGRGESGLTN